MAKEKRLIEIPSDGIICIPIMEGNTTVGEGRVDLSWYPTVDAVEVVHGHKVVRERNRGIAFAMECPICNSKIPSNKPYTEKVEYCSVCGKRLDDTFQNYCPNCGAKMYGERRTDDG